MYVYLTWVLYCMYCIVYCICLLVPLCVTDRSQAILLWWFFLFYVLVFIFFIFFFVLLAPYVCFHIFKGEVRRL